MVGVVLEFSGDVVFDRAFDRIDVFASGDAGAIADAEDMSVDGLGGLLEPHVQYHIRRFAPHSRQRLQGGTRGWHNPIVVIDQNTAEFDHVLRLLAEQADGLDVFDQALFAQIQHLLRGVGDLEQLFRGLVHAHIRRLRRQGHRHHQRIGIGMVQLPFGFWVQLAEAGEDLVDLVISKLLGHSAGNAPSRPIAQVPGRFPRGLCYCDRASEDKMPNDHSYHYATMRRAIERIDAADAPLTLEELAAEMNMSPAHFQKTFTAWVGVSPKRFQQYLTLGHAKSLLRERFTTLDAADAVGLSGSGRLHDLFLRWEAMSPGEYAKGGAGLTIRYGFFDSPFGEALVMATDKGLCGLAFSAECGHDEALADLTSRWPQARYVEDPSLDALANAIFTCKGEADLHLIGRPLQIKVWEALLSIPSGRVSTYSEIARAIGSPKAVRAVGTAVGHNPIGFLIPCHRALRKSGGLGGYHWGLPVKRAMLAWEAARADSA